MKRKWFVIFIVLFLMSFVTDHIIFNFSEFGVAKYIGIKVIYFVFLGVLLWAIKKLIEYLKIGDEDIRKSVQFGIVVWCVLLVCVVMVYPGIYQWDTMEMLSLARSLNLSNWHGFYMQLLYVLSLMLIPFPVGVLVVQTFLISLFAIRENYICRRIIGRKGLSNFLIIFFLLPTNIYWSVYPYRTIFFGLFVSLVLLEVLYMNWVEKVSFGQLVYVATILGFGWSIRSEGYCLLILIVILPIIYRKKIGMKKMSAWFVMTLLITLIVKAPLVSDRSYVATAILNPLQCMMHYDLQSDDLQRDLSNIDVVFDVDTMKNTKLDSISGNSEGTAWQVEGFWDNIYCDENDWNNMLKSYVNLVYYNPQLFVKVRMQTFLAAITQVKSDVPNIQQTVVGMQDRFEFGRVIGGQVISERLRTRFSEFISFTWFMDGKMSAVLGSPLIPVLLIVFVLCASIIDRNILYFCVNVVLLMMLGVVFITEPIANSMYYISFYDSVYLLLLINIVKATDKVLKKEG